MINTGKRKVLLYIDGCAALLSGVVVFTLREWFSPMFNLSIGLLTTLAIISLMYSPYSFYLATRPTIPTLLVKILGAANSAYGFACVGLLLLHFRQASAFGIAYFLIDIICVFLLAYLEFYYIVKASNDHP